MLRIIHDKNNVGSNSSWNGLESRWYLTLFVIHFYAFCLQERTQVIPEVRTMLLDKYTSWQKTINCI